MYTTYHCFTSTFSFLPRSSILLPPVAAGHAVVPQPRRYAPPPSTVALSPRYLPPLACPLTLLCAAPCHPPGECGEISAEQPEVVVVVARIGGMADVGGEDEGLEGARVGSDDAVK